MAVIRSYDRPGDMVWARLDQGQTHFFDPASGNVIDTRLGH